LLEDYFQHIVINELSQHDEKDAELEVWENDVWNNPDEFEKWATEQKRKIDELKHQIGD